MRQIISHISTATRSLRRTLGVMLMMMVVGVSKMWGQETPDYSGTYFIRSGGVRNQSSGGYYLCPTEGWAYFYATNDLRNDDNGQPFLTTHHMGNGDYAKYKWIIEKHTIGNHDYYAFKYSIDYVEEDLSYSRYLSYNRKLAGNNVYADRMRVHLKKTDSQNLTEYELFDITETTQTINNIKRTYLVISPLKKDEDDGNKLKYLVVNGGNTDAFKSYFPGNNIGTELYVLNKGNGPSPYTLTTGIIGTYDNIKDDNAPFYLEKTQCSTPIISFNSSTSEVTITSETDGTTIYYTTNSSTPDPANVGGEHPTKEYNSSDKPTINNQTTIKAIAVKTNMDDSEVATKTIEKLVSPSVTFVDATQKVIITSEEEGATNVYTTDGNDPTPSTWEEYSEAISLTGTTTVKAMTVKDGYVNSNVESLTVTKLTSSPSISKDGSTVTLSYSDPDATIHYTTDGTPPTQQSSSYSAALTLDGNQKYTIMAIAAKTGHLNSVVAEDVVDNRTSIDAPTITYTGNAVTITASDYGDEIYYTTDGTPPTTSTTTHFTSSNTIYLVNGSNYTVRAIASNGVINSDEATETINLTNVGYSGIYYIQNNANSGDYFMYPVGGQSALVKTAQKTDQDAIWKIEIVGDYYHIIHYGDGKYLVAENVVDGVMPDEETVSLVATNSPGDNALFEITRKSGDESDILQQIILIRPKAAANANGHIYLNTRGGNGSNHTIGLWDNTGSSEWKLATVPAKPTFSVNDINVTISNDLGDVHYTIDGTNPTSSSPSGKNVTLEYGPIYTVKAISIYHDEISNTDWTSGVATSDQIQVDLLNPIVTRSGNNVTITNSQSPRVTFSYTFSDNGNDPVDPVPPIGAGTDYTSALPLTANARNAFKVIAYNTVDATTYTSEIVTFVVDLRSATTISSLAGITNATGNYKLASDFSPTGTPQEGGVEIGTSSNPFRGTIDGNLIEFELTSPLFDYVENATIKNVIISNATISTSGNAGAIANNALGATCIYNCGVLATGSTVEKDDNGYDHISSCSSTISGSGYVGGIVGLLDGSSRVINCFSYANITGGTNVGGIVGWNNVNTTSTNLATMVMNCMFYGDITGGTSKAPIYNGKIITNDGDADGVNNFNYFWSGASYVQKQEIDNARYNCALAAETRYLQRFEFFRQLLNSNRELAAWWATGDVDNKDEMMKWVMEPSQIGTATPYPILKNSDRYPSVVNIDVNHSESYNGRDLTVGPNFNNKTLSVTIRNSTTDAVFGAPDGADIKTTSLSLKIMDKDPDHFNFNYYKVQLPYYNDVGIGNYTGNRVVTGWKIVSISGGTNSYSTDNDNEATTPADAEAEVDANGNITLTTPYNFADRKCTQKDLYGDGGSNRIFNQGAYWDVPEGVTAITIEPYWAKAVYLSDAYWDVVYKNGTGNGNAAGSASDAMNAPADVTTVGGGIRYENGIKYDLATHSPDNNGQIVYTSMGNAIASSGSALFSGVNANNHSVYDYAVVLVGNYHHNAYTNDLQLAASNSKPYTVTSIDLDGDNEPDYSYILRFNGRVRVHPVRIDFLNVIGLGMAQKTTGGTGTYNFGILQPKGWFECTNTALFRVTQFEYDLYDSNTSGSARMNSPIILQGGVIEQWVTVGGAEQRYQEAKSVSYYHVGGNVWFKEFHIGVHQDKNERRDNNPNPDQFVSPHPPISVTGGDFNEFYLTGLYNTPNANYDDNAECYINGGRFGKVAGTAMQGIGGFTMDGDVKTDYDNGNIIWQIDNADIDEFYAGGINAAHIAEGSIYTVITNSRVDQFCGGPKFGDMNNDQIVITNATNCTFRTFFGAGYGGNSYNRRYPANQNNVTNINWNNWVSGQYTKKYDANYNGVETRIDYQFLPMSNNTANVARLFVDYVSFSLATTYKVTSKLTGCTITKSALGRLDISANDQRLGNFYGGGSLGKVDGPVTSTLINCTVEGNVYGAGYSATQPTVSVMNNAFQTSPRYDGNLGAYLEAKLPATTPYTWEHADEVNSDATAINTGTTKLYTTVDLSKSNLGSVSGAVRLTITTDGENGKTIIGTTNNQETGHVYGGGDESYVSNAVTPSQASTIVTISGNTDILGNVFGGGNHGNVSGSTTVNIQQ